MRPARCLLLIVGALLTPPPVPAAAPPAKGDPPHRWMLAGEPARRVAQWERQVRQEWAAGDFAAAEEAARRIVALRSRLQGAGHWETVEARFRVSAMHQANGLKGKQRARFRTLPAQIEKAVGLYRKGRYTQAEALFRSKMELCRAVLGERHPETLDGYGGTAACLDVQGKAVRAEPLHRKALELCRAVLAGKGVEVSVWRQRKTFSARLPAGALGLSVDRRPAPEAVRANREAERTGWPAKTG
jgi:hypothetical protein